MVGRTADRSSQSGRLWLGLALASALVALFAVLLASPLDPQIKRVASGIGLVSGGVGAAFGFVYQYRRSTGRRRTSCALFGIAVVWATTSNAMLLLWASQPGASVRLAEVALGLALVFGVAGLISFPVARRRGTDLARMVLDGIVIGGSLLFVVSVTLVPQILDTAESGLAALIVPVSDVVIATVASLLFLRGAPADRPALGLVAISFAGFAVSDFSYAYQLSESRSFSYGTLADLGWIAGWTLIALAVRLPSTGATTPTGERAVELSPVLGTIGIFGLFMIAAVMGLFGQVTGTLDARSAVVWLLVLLAIVARQIVLILDNEQLRRILEQRVIDRNRSLREVTEQSDLLLSSVGDGIYGVDRDGLITFANPAASRLLGYPPQAMIARDAHSTFHAAAADPAEPAGRCYIAEAIGNGRTTSAEDDTYVRADGLEVPVEVTATPLYENGAVTGAVVVFRDVTQRREVDRMKTEFVSMVSHELRTPLTAISGSLGLIAGGALGAIPVAVARMVDIALISSERLGRMINEILDIERIESGGLAMTSAEHDAADLISTAVGQVQVLAAEAGVELVVAEVEGRVRADSDRVVQTLLNLIGNAIKFSPSGTTVTISAQPREAFVEFAIADQGRGVPEDKLDRIFERFEQVDSSDAREKGGSGLGLAISRSIVERLGGRIWADHGRDRGAVFRFTLPVVAAPARPVRQLAYDVSAEVG